MERPDHSWGVPHVVLVTVGHLEVPFVGLRSSDRAVDELLTDAVLASRGSAVR